MAEFDPNDDEDEDARSSGTTDRSNTHPGIVNLGINVGIQSLTDLLSLLDAESGAQRGPRRGAPDDEAPLEDAEAWSADATSGPADQRTHDYLVDTHRTEDWLVVTAELPGVSEEELAVGIDVPSKDLVIAVNGRPIERVALPWSSTEAAKVWFNNEILEVRLEPEDGSETDEGPGGSA